MATAATVTGVLAVSGGVAAAFHIRQNELRNSAEADASQASDTGTVSALAGRNTVADQVNRDAQRPDLTQGTDQGSPTSPTASPDQAPIPTSAKGPTPAPTTPKPVPPVGQPKPLTIPTSTPPAPPKPPVTSTTAPKPAVGMGYGATPAQAQAIARSIVPSSQFQCFSNIIEHESSWNLHATNASSGAYGLGQALPAIKMAPYGADWRNSATVQIKWALAYMTSRYGSPCAAWAFWSVHHWY